MVNVRRVDELASLLGWDGVATPGLSWEDVEADLGFNFPDGYKDLLKIFPSGEFADGIFLVSPVQHEAALALFKTRIEVTLEHFSSAREVLPEFFPHKFHPESGGLIPWATDDDHCYFWSPVPATDPNEWPIAFLDNSGSEWGFRDGTVAGFLFDVITGDFQHDALYSNWSDLEKKFRPVDYR